MEAPQAPVAVELSSGEIEALVVAAHEQAEALSARLGAGAASLASYGAAIAAGGVELGAGPDARALAQLIDRLGAATVTMTEANQRLEAELANTARETGQLRDRLHAAEAAAVTDPLTGVLNRRGALRRLAAALATGEVSVAMVDIDHFKRVNDRFGHAMGDEVLRYVAAHLVAAAARGTVGRLGGEEFVVMLPGCPLAEATGLIDRARAGLAARIIRRGDDGSSMGRVTFSAGTAQSAAGENADTLLARADAALYAAKRMGRDRVLPG